MGKSPTTCSITSKSWPSIIISATTTIPVRFSFQNPTTPSLFSLKTCHQPCISSRNLVISSSKPLIFPSNLEKIARFSALNQLSCDSSIPECSTAGLETPKYLYQLSLANTGFQKTSQTTEIMVYFSSPSIYIVETAFLRASETNYTQLPVTTKTFENGTSYYSVQIKGFLDKNSSYTFELVIKKNPNNDEQSNFATYPQTVTFWLANYYTNNFLPYSGLISHVNFDLENIKPKKQSEFSVRFESYVILMIFCGIALGFLIVFIFINLFTRRGKNNKVAFQPLDKAKNEVIEPHSAHQTPLSEDIELSQKPPN